MLIFGPSGWSTWTIFSVWPAGLDPGHRGAASYSLRLDPLAGLQICPVVLSFGTPSDRKVDGGCFLFTLQSEAQSNLGPALYPGPNPKFDFVPSG